MRRQRIFLLDAHFQDARSVAEIERGLTSKGFSVTRLVVSPGALDGTDQSLIDLLNQVRANDALQSEGPASQRILLGWGLAGSLALWLCALDAERPKEFSVGRSSITLDIADPDFPNVFAGVVALHPFLGFDFRSGEGQGALSLWRGLQFRLFKSRFGRVLARGAGLPDLGPYGCPTDRRPSWRAVVESVFSYSVTETLPALKRPTVIGIDGRGGFDRVQLQLSVLKSGVWALDCPNDPADRLQATLQAIDFLEERLPNRQ